MPFRVRFLKCYFMGLGVGAGPYIRDPRLEVYAATRVKKWKTV